MKRISEWWPWLFFFKPETPFNLGVCRICFFGFLFLDHLKFQPQLWGEVDRSFWIPLPLFQLLGWKFASVSTLVLLKQIWMASLFLGCIGLLTQWASLIALILGTYLLGLHHNVGFTSYEDALLIFVLLILTVARSGNSLSCDQWLRTRRVLLVKQQKDSAEYRWPIRLVWALMTTIFFSAGVAKLRYSGLSWVFSDNLSNILLLHHYRGGDVPTTLGISLAAWPFLCRLTAGMVVVLELCAPLALVSKNFRFPIVFCLLAMQVGIAYLLGVSFQEYYPCYLFWIPWDQLPGLRSQAQTLYPKPVIE